MSRHAATYTCDLCGSENAARNALARAEAEVLAERKRGDEYLAKWGDALKAVARLTDEARARELVLKDSVATWRNAHELLEAKVARLKGYVRMALDELGVPTDMYPANVTNAVEFLSECFNADLAARADAIIPLNDEQAEAFKALSESIKSEQRLEAELAKAPTWPTVEALQEQLKASEAKFQRCLKSENAARSALARSEAEVARLNKLDTTYHHD